MVSTHRIREVVLPEDRLWEFPLKAVSDARRRSLPEPLPLEVESADADPLRPLRGVGGAPPVVDDKVGRATTGCRGPH